MGRVGGSLDELNGLSACLSGDFGAGPSGGVTICGGLNADLSFNGIVTVFPHVGIGLHGLPAGSANVVISRTTTQEWFGTPSVVRWLLPDLGGDSGYQQEYVNPDGSRTSGGQNRCMDAGGVPPPPGGSLC